MKTIFYLLLFLTLSNFIAFAQWFPQNSGTTANLTDVFFITPNIGWACSDDGSILKTTNGGSTWLPQNPPLTSYLNSIFFLDINTGWACGSGIILKTTNGGTTWEFDLHSMGTLFNDIQFINENIGWVIMTYVDTSYILKSTNGGATWTTQFQESGEYYGALFFLNEFTGWVAKFGFVLKTTDGGSTWNSFASNFASGYMSIQFIDALTGWASHQTLGGSLISKTTDGGLNWINQYTDNTRFIYSVSFANSSIGYAAGYRMFVPPTPYRGFVLKTTDGGSTWTEQYSEVGELYSIYFVDDLVGWAVGKEGKIIFTINGGVPVELMSFTATASETSVLLEWITATEINNQGFEIQRQAGSKQNAAGNLTDGEAIWDAIGFIEGNGTTTEINYYYFVDEGLLPGKYFYRLKQIDFDGSFEYSDVVDVDISPPNFYLSQNYPNPFNPGTTISWQLPINSLQTLKVYDVLGREVATLVNEERPAGYYEVTFDASNISSGIYYYQLRAGSFVETKKMIYLK